VHRPQHQIVPTARITDPQRVVHASPVDAIGAHRMRDEIMIWQDQMKQMVQPIVIDNIHVTNRFSAAFCFCKHDTSQELENEKDGNCLRTRRYRATRTSDATMIALFCQPIRVTSIAVDRWRGRGFDLTFRWRGLCATALMGYSIIS
jgi:hypothetical protein